jgi:hypothetical protein
MLLELKLDHVKVRAGRNLKGLCFGISDAPDV